MIVFEDRDRGWQSARETPELRAQQEAPDPRRRLQVAEGAGLTLVIGPPNAGKMGYVLDWWRANMARRPILVAPNFPEAAELTAEMARRVGGVVGQTPALTFDGLVEQILGRRPRYLSDFQRQILVMAALQQPGFRL
ncbi:MAG: hypothetical protein H5T84_04855, partial [Thermoleophilia bacterium]|nr:hypothetical protein [Thermoleophilia bacterium]